MAKKATLLIVEDEVPIAMSMQQVLQKSGYHVPDFATDGRAALELAEQLKPDLALVDIKLPDMDGVELAKKLKEEHQVRSVYVTSLTDEGTYERAKEATPLDYLTKPVENERLCEAVEWALLDLAELQFEIGKTVPNAEEWMNMPNEQLGGMSPRETIGTAREIDLRRLIRAAIQGTPT